MSRADLAALRAADALATAVATYGIPLLVLTTTGSSALTGLAFVTEWVPRLTAYAIGGPAVDRYRTTSLLHATAWARAALMAAAAALAATGPSGHVATTVVMASGAVSGLLGQISFVGTEDLGARLTRQVPEAGHRLQALQVAIDQGALLLAPLLSGLLLLAGPRPVLITVSALSAATALSTRRVRTLDSGTPAPPRHRSTRTALTIGWRTIGAIPALAWLVTGLMASNFAVATFQASSPILLLHQFGRSAVQTGAVWSAAGAAALVTVSLCGRAVDRWGLWPVAAVAATAACLACVTAATAALLPLYAASVAVLVGAEGAITVVLRTLRARLIPADRFGATFAATAVLVIAPMPVAGLLVATVPTADLKALLLAAAAVQAAAMTVALTGLRRHRSAYTAPTPEHINTPEEPPSLTASAHTPGQSPHLEGTR